MGRYPKIRTIKICNFCGKDEIETEFNKDYKPTECKSCLGKRRKAWYEINKYEANRRKVEKRRLTAFKVYTRKRGRPKTQFVEQVTSMEFLDSVWNQLIENHPQIELPVYSCNHFGCGKILTRTEKLAGNKCINHCMEERRVF